MKRGGQNENAQYDKIIASNSFVNLQTCFRAADFISGVFVLPGKERYS
jgi:hypothetical protein